jgi:hypothetical protein
MRSVQAPGSFFSLDDEKALVPPVPRKSFTIIRDLAMHARASTDNSRQR